MKTTLGIIGLIIIFFFVKTYSYKTEYYVFCETGKCSESESFQKRNFYVSPETQTVVVGENGFLVTLQGCSVISKKHWVCIEHTQIGDIITNYYKGVYSRYPRDTTEGHQEQVSYPIWLFKEILNSIKK